jgi:hypothetical protein
MNESIKLKTRWKFITRSNYMHTIRATALDEEEDNTIIVNSPDHLYIDLRVHAMLMLLVKSGSSSVLNQPTSLHRYFILFYCCSYGDRIPRTPLGRIICIVWILIGVILIACFNSTMTSILTARILDKDIMLYGTKV